MPFPIAYGQENLESKIEVRTKSLQAASEDIVSVNGLTKEGVTSFRPTDFQIGFKMGSVLEFLSSVGVPSGGRHNLDAIASFVRNPLVQQQITKGLNSSFFLLRLQTLNVRL